MSVHEVGMQRDWWPLTRLIIMVAAMACWGRALWGWRCDPQEFCFLLGRILAVFSLRTLVSYSLAHLFLVILMLPIYSLLVMEDWFYIASVSVCRVVLRCRSDHVVALAGLCGEIVLFGLCLFALGRFAARF